MAAIRLIKCNLLPLAQHQMQKVNWLVIKKLWNLWNFGCGRLTGHVWSETIFDLGYIWTFFNYLNSNSLTELFQRSPQLR